MRFIRIPSWRAIVSSMPLLGLIGVFVLLPVGYGTVSYTTRPEFCRSCHIMEPYVASWEESAHHAVPCVDCHYEPGLLETAEGKFKALSQLAKYVTGTEGTKPWAEVSDSSCMRTGCHTTRLLEGEVEFDVGRVALTFSHAPHLLEMRRSKKLRCTSCHSQIVQGEHVAVTPSTCFLCHLTRDEEDPKLSECGTCHETPREPIPLEGFVYRHEDYVERGVDCKSCHAEVTSGTGEVPKRRCGSCHAVAEHIERYGETEFLHRKHVTDHKVDCLECHTEIVHRLAPREPEAKDDSCARCHGSSHGFADAFLRGEGGRGVAATPSAMWLARVSCTGCHMRLPGLQPTGRAPVAAREVACLACHGPGFQGMMGRWQDRYGETTESLHVEVTELLHRARGSDVAADLVPLLEDALHDVALVKSDGSRGVHNPWFARGLLQAAETRAEEARLRFEPGHERARSALDPPFETEQSCALLCHMGIEERAITLPATRFDHTRHLGRAGDCDTCHSIEPEEHGVTKIGPQDCNACHHAADSEKAADCTSCHAETDRFLRGIEPGFDEPVQMMAKVTCAECHGAPPAAEIHETVQASCVRCHEDQHEDALEEWLEYGEEWLEEAEDELAPLRERARAAGGEAAEALSRAEALVARIKRVRPAHNVLLFDELTEVFAGLVEEIESALR